MRSLHEIPSAELPGATLDATAKLWEQARQDAQQPTDDLPSVPGLNDKQGQLVYFAGFLNDPAVSNLLWRESPQRGISFGGQTFSYHGVELRLSFGVYPHPITQDNPHFRIILSTPETEERRAGRVGSTVEFAAVEEVRNRFMGGGEIGWASSSVGSGFSQSRAMRDSDFASPPGDPINRGAIFDAFYAGMAQRVAGVEEKLRKIHYAG